MKIFGDDKSGNCLKVRYVADHLGVPYAWIPVDIMKGETRTPEFLARFPVGQVPGVEFADGRCLSQSNAIIRHLARGSALLPEDPWQQAKIDEWLFWEQYNHEPTIAVCRFHMRYRGEPAETRDPRKVAGGEAALDLMERRLVAADWFVGDAITIADVALFAYTQFADEGGFSLDTRPAVRSWLTRCIQALGLPGATSIAVPG
ncbi:glutathione S-transferase family protein [Methylobacterium isbiliense]|uniref:Disulfide-bond oxidoreductase YfcG n=1 Tax=Methylobacterium isbiliense TaxID=315478 RepID=A0ABQ4SD59_9HYPH|nr:glutathione S-transferase family protein [Methylobacterium isbiliense]MDN3622996.1 glutathione S-transferase family protein [Methylobacterium isbiliense]GJE00328.1 Disulfide-bond oxidoreductase YfcG [Methylobacterium isbiliense]